MRAATCGKGTNPIRMRDFARLTLCHDEIFAGHSSPGDIGRAGASPAIYAMTIAWGQGRTFQHVSCPAANASTGEFHIVRLPHFNHECTLLRKAAARQALMNTNHQPVCPAENWCRFVSICGCACLFASNAANSRPEQHQPVQRNG